MAAEAHFCDRFKRALFASVAMRFGSLLDHLLQQSCGLFEVSPHCFTRRHGLWRRFRAVPDNLDYLLGNRTLSDHS